MTLSFTPTESDLRDAAAMLRNAALVMDTVGLTRQQYIGVESGRVCLEGALVVAGRSQLRTIFVSDVQQQKWVRFGCSMGDTPSQAYCIAVDSLIDLLPESCHEHAPGTCPFIYGRFTNEIYNGVERIHHYNDFVCTGDEEASGLLVTAAEKIEANL